MTHAITDRPSISNITTSEVPSSGKNTCMALQLLSDTALQVMESHNPDQTMLQVAREDFSTLGDEMSKLPQTERKQAEEILQKSVDTKDIKSFGKSLLDLLKWAVGKVFNGIAKAVVACMTWVAHALQSAFKFAEELFKDLVDGLKHLLAQAKHLASEIKSAIEDLIAGLSAKKGSKTEAKSSTEAPSMTAKPQKASSNPPSTRLQAIEGAPHGSAKTSKTSEKPKVDSTHGQKKVDGQPTVSSTQPKRTVQQSSVLGAELLKQLTSEQADLLKSDDRLMTDAKKSERMELAAHVMGFKDAASCDKDSLRSSYKKMAIQFHPDRNPQNKEEAGAHFANVGNAYKILCQKLGI